MASRPEQLAPHHVRADTATLVEGARQCDRSCWDALVDQFSGLIWSVARGFGMSRADAAEVSQITWLRLAEHLSRIEQPDRLGAWLVTTARRECLRQRRLHGRMVLVEDLELERGRPAGTGADDDVLTNERDAALWRCLDALPERARTLLMMLLTDPPMSYTEIGAALDMPVGSIGPTRARILTMLRRDVEAAGITRRD